MKIDIENWADFRIGDYFDIRPTKAYPELNNKDLDDGGETPFVVNSGVNNGIGGYSTLAPTEKGNIITFSDTTDSNTFFYQPDDFIGFAHVQGMHPKGTFLNNLTALFLIQMIRARTAGMFNYGRKMRRDIISETLIRLPSASDGKPDWKWMEDYVKSLRSEPITTGCKNPKSLDSVSWSDFPVKELFDVRYGINMELNACTETNKNDPEAIAFVARTSENNGVSAFVKPEEGKTPQPAYTITVAGGGSVLSTFLQIRPFYSGRDLYLLLPKQEISNYAKLFIVTVLQAEKYRFNYGRQANKTLPDLNLHLPITSDGKPDWQFMEDYIKSLPYGDRIIEAEQQ